MTDQLKNAAHRDLVAALGDELAPDGGAAEWLESAEWAEAVDRVRARRFPDVPRDEAFRAVGQLIAERYLSSEVGKLLLQSLRLLPKERVFVTVAPAMAARLRPGFTWKWEPAAAGGLLRLGGRRVTPAATTLGFFEVMVRALGPGAQARLGRADAECIELAITW